MELESSVRHQVVCHKPDVQGWERRGQEWGQVCAVATETTHGVTIDFSLTQKYTEFQNCPAKNGCERQNTAEEISWFGFGYDLT